MSESRLLLATLTVCIIDALLLAVGVLNTRSALLLFLMVELPLVITTIVLFAKRYSRARREGGRAEALATVVENDPVLRFGRAELENLVALVRWVTRRPEVPEGFIPLHHNQGSNTVPMVLAGASVLEIVAVHFVVPWTVPRIILMVLGVYGICVVLGMAATRYAYPHLLSREAIVLRQGRRVVARVLVESIASSNVVQRYDPNYMSFTEMGVPALASQDGTNMELHSRSGTRFSIRTYPWSIPDSRESKSVRLYLDEPRSLLTVLPRS